ncbi:MAG: glycosyltransferase family 1 protein [Actinomycetales bacterium]|nr:MAG: glycosyltransferase family 1 protein [Actinomycetales bacterium]
MGTDFGGIRTYVEHLLRAWSLAYPDDELVVLTPVGSTLDVAGHERHEVVFGSPGPLRRPWAVTRAVQTLVRERGADAVLATFPATTLRRPGVPLAVVVHDLRHERRPEQFTRGRRVLRRISYSRAYRIADTRVAISRRTLDDLTDLHPATRSAPNVVIHHGADHVLGWPTGQGTGGAIAFAHHTNKNPHLVIDAWALLRDRGLARPLTVLGVGSALRAELSEQVERLGLGESVRLAPYLDDDEYLATVAEASLMVFPSDFEGFGLPVLEAMMLRMPVVIAPEPASLEVAGEHAFVADGWTPEALAEAVLRADAQGPDAREAARAWAEAFTWEQTARRTREALVGPSSA